MERIISLEKYTDNYLYDIDDIIEKVRYKKKSFSSQIRILIGDIIGCHKCSVEYTTYNKPFVLSWYYDIGGACIYINPTYYKDNYNEINDKLIKILSKADYNSIDIDENIILDEKLIEAITRNKHLKKIFLKNRILDKELYDKLESNKPIELYSFNVEPELYEVFDGTIPHNFRREFIDEYCYSELSVIETLKITRKYTEKELGYLINNLNLLYCVVIEENGEDLLEYGLFFLEQIKHLLPNIYMIELRINNKLEHNIDIFEKYRKINKKVTIKHNDTSVSLDKYIETLYSLEDVIKPIVSLNLSPLEQYLYIYNYVKNFRKYKEVDKNIDVSLQRDIFKILDENNNYIVCTGFSALLEELSNLLKIRNDVVYMTFYKVLNNNEIKLDGYHARNIVKLEDDKYNIHGMFLSDATWANLDEKSLLYSLISLKDSLNHKYLIQRSTYDLLCANSYNEFIGILNIKIRNDELGDLLELFDVLISLYPDFADICSKREVYKSYIRKTKKILYIKEIYNDEIILRAIYNIATNSCNNYIDPMIILTAATNLYKKLNPNITKEELDNYLKDLIVHNYSLYETHFPLIVGKHYDDTYTILGNEQNIYGIGPRKIKE